MIKLLHSTILHDGQGRLMQLIVTQTNKPSRNHSTKLAPQPRQQRAEAQLYLWEIGTFHEKGSAQAQTFYLQFKH